MRFRWQSVFITKNNLFFTFFFSSGTAKSSPWCCENSTFQPSPCTRWWNRWVWHTNFTSQFLIESITATLSLSVLKDVFQASEGAATMLADGRLCQILCDWYIQFKHTPDSTLLCVRTWWRVPYHQSSELLNQLGLNGEIIFVSSKGAKWTASTKLFWWHRTRQRKGLKHSSPDEWACRMNDCSLSSPETAICKPRYVQGQRLQNPDCHRRGCQVRSSAEPPRTCGLVVVFHSFLKV